MNLAETQELFWRVIAERRAVSRVELERVFIGTASLSVVERLEIYGSMYIHRLVDALGAEFPLMKEQLGDEAFFAVAEAYVRAHPSVHPSIAHVGRELGAFLRTRGEHALADLATLERTRALVFEASDDTPIGADALGQVPPDDLGDVVLRPIAALALVGDTAVFRRDFSVREAKLDALETRALQRMLDGKTLGEICDVFADQPDPVVAAFQVIGRWLASGWIAAPPASRPARC